MSKKSVLRVAVIMGGDSAEREVSLKTGAAVMAGLKEAGFKTKAYDLRDELEAFFIALKQAKHDVVFIALHGPGGEDGKIQGMLELLKIPYTGSNVLSSALAMDKARTKDIYRTHNLPVAKDLILTRAEWKDDKQNILRRKIKAVGDAIVLKPINDGSSIGLTVNPPKATWEKVINTSLHKHSSLLIEEYIEGREFTVGIFDGKALPVVEIRAKDGLFSYEAKYLDKSTAELCPAPINSTLTRKAQALALQAHQSLGCRSYSRTDLLLHPKRGFILLETNTLPGLTVSSLIPKELKAANISFTVFLRTLIRDAMMR